MNRKLWDATRTYRELKRWVDANNERINVDGRNKLKRVAEGLSGSFIGAMDLRLQSMMYAAKGLIGLMDSNLDDLSLVYQASYASKCALMVSAAYFYYYLPDVTPTCSINAVSLDFARTVALGSLDDAATMADLIWHGLIDGLFHDDRHSRIVPFILRLYSRWRCIPAPSTRFPPKKEPIYDRLLELWDTVDVDPLIAALNDACDLHIERSKDTTNREDYEFNDTEFNLQPVEIMMVMRLREYKNLDIPRLNHPVMNTPVARLYPVRTVDPDPLIEAALAVELARVEDKKKLQRDKL